jgi:hypothetical protein
MRQRWRLVWLTTILLAVAGSLLYWQWPRTTLPEPAVTASPDATATLPAKTPDAADPAALPGQLALTALDHFTWTLPSQWQERVWRRDDLRSAAKATNQPAQLQTAISLLIQAADDRSRLYVAQPPAESRLGDVRLMALSFTRAGLRLEQALEMLQGALAASDRLRVEHAAIDASLRPDGQPVARIRYTLLNAAAQPVLRNEGAMLLHPSADQLLLLLWVTPNELTTEQRQLQEQIFVEIISKLSYY